MQIVYFFNIALAILDFSLLPPMILLLLNFFASFCCINFYIVSLVPFYIALSIVITLPNYRPKIAIEQYRKEAMNQSRTRYKNKAERSRATTFAIAMLEQ